MSGLDWFALVSGVLSILGTLVSIGAAIAAFRQARRAADETALLREETRKETARLDHLIPIVLQRHDGEAEYTLQAPIRRRDIARAEILGRLGTVRRTPLAYDKKQGFVLRATSNPDFFDALDRVRTSSNPKDRLLVTCYPAEPDDRPVFQHEFDQFDLPVRPVI
ncbi:MAG: hypothetical protein AAGI52_09420 [Bacteroidota bacterium]